MTTHSLHLRSSRNNRRNVKNASRSRALESRIDLRAGFQILYPLSEERKADNPLCLLSLQIGRKLLLFIFIFF